MSISACSCDTFAVLPPGTPDYVVFGKNADRPANEVQEVVFVPAADHPPSSRQKCTYIEIEQISHTYATILSKPAWMWGAEMGANEHGVCIGNEAVYTKMFSSSDLIERLLGMDLLRLGLERSKTALDAVHVITELLELHGQGGNCSDTVPDFTYHNSFLIADPSEVWVLETAEKFWAAERIEKGIRNISNELSIGTKIDLMSSGLQGHAEQRGFWHAKFGSFNFKKAFGLSSDDEEDLRYKCGKRLLTNFSASGNFKVVDMFKVLRDKDSGICMSCGSFVSAGSQVSIIRPPSSGMPSVHWFTATPDPSKSIFKPFVFTENVNFPHEVVSPVPSHGNADRRHALYQQHEECRKNKWNYQITKRSMDLELHLLESALNAEKCDAKNLFKYAVEEELKIYA